MSPTRATAGRPTGPPSRRDSKPAATVACTSASRSAAKAALAAWETAHPKPHATLEQVADHIEHIRAVAGVDHVGIGSDFDGIADTPRGLEGVDRFPALLAELMRRGWTDADIAKIAGGNVLRAFAEAERVSARLRATRPASLAVVEVAPKV